jgi:hypothetical protein
MFYQMPFTISWKILRFLKLLPGSMHPLVSSLVAPPLKYLADAYKLTYLFNFTLLVLNAISINRLV